VSEWVDADEIPFEVRLETSPLTAEQEELAARSDWNGRELEPANPRPPLEIKDATIQEFASTEEEGAEPLVGSDDGNVLIGQGSDVMFYGDGGAGKTTLTIDLACHLAAGDDWLGISIPRPVHVYVIENEGPRHLFRPKLKRKIEAWAGSPLDDRIHVLEEPWAQFSFADPAWREAIAGRIRELEIDVHIVGPLTASGMDLPGTIQECRAFTAFVDEVRALAGRPFANVIAHHENQGGKVSGAWQGVGDGLFHVRKRGHGRTDLHFEKARWASDYHGKTFELDWAEGESFTRREKEELDEEALTERILELVDENDGPGWTQVSESITGASNEEKKKARDRALATGKLVNRNKDDELLDHVEARKQTRLYRADDPTISHLRRDSGAVAAQKEIGDYEDIKF
jgi:hypothetical protein